MKKHTHIIYRKKWEGNKKKSKMMVKMEQPLVACMCGSFCSDLGQLEKETEIIISVEQSSWMDFTAFNCSQQQVLLLFFTL